MHAKEFLIYISVCSNTLRIMVNLLGRGESKSGWVQQTFFIQ